MIGLFRMGFANFFEMLDIALGAAALITGPGKDFTVFIQQQDGGKSPHAVFLRQLLILFLSVSVCGY